MAQYIPFNTFIMVVTPHATEQCGARVGMSLVTFLSINNLNIPELFGKLEKDECFAVPVGGLLLYVKKIYNVQRHRLELECISLTPSVHVHTLDKTFAKTVDEKRVPESSFPQWFKDETD